MDGEAEDVANSLVSSLEQPPLCRRCPDSSRAYDPSGGGLLHGPDEELLSPGSVDRWFRESGFRCRISLCRGILPLLFPPGDRARKSHTIMTGSCP